MTRPDVVLAGVAEGAGQAGPLALLIIVVLGIAVVLLVRSMNTRLRRMKVEFDPTLQDRRRPAPPADADRPD